MIQLNNIEISNARRLSNKVDIEFGKGATIIVAPNGTGKTTIFEAIELAITGDIQRLSNCKEAFIKEGMDSMSVKLDFNHNFSQFILNKDGTFKSEGDIYKILDTSEDISIPYLYKLTHFFEQSNKNWFVGCDGSEAGALLSKLPIGKDVQNILSKKTAVLRAITKIEGDVQNELRYEKEELRKLEGLLTKRKELDSEIPTMQPCNIAERITSLSEIYNYQLDYSEFDVNKMTADVELLKNKILEQQEQNNSRYNRLLAFSERVDFYHNNLSEIADKHKTINEYTEVIKEKECILVKKLNDKKCVLDQLKITEEAKNKLESVISQYNKSDLLQRNIIEQEKNIDVCREEIKAIQDIVNSQNAIIEKNCQIKDQHRIIQEALKGQMEKLEELENKKTKLMLWSSYITELCLKKQEIQSIHEAVNKKETEKKELERAIEQSEFVYESNNKALLLLEQSSAEITKALSIISKNIGVNTRNCPVCQAEYEPSELKKRISTALLSLNPLLDKAVTDEKASLEILKDYENRLLHSNRNIENLYKEYNILKKKMMEMEDNIANIKKELSIEESDIESEKTVLGTSILENKDMVLKLQEKRDALPSVEMQQENSAKEIYLEKERILFQLKEKLELFELEKVNEEKELDILKLNLKDKNKENIVADSLKYLKELEQLKIELAERESHENSLKAELEKIKENTFAEKETLSMINTAQMAVINEWNQFKIGEGPDKEKLQDACKRLKIADNQYSKDISEGYDLQSNLSMWRIYLQNENITKEIQETVGDKDAREYCKELEKKVSDKEKNAENIKIRKSAITSFFEAIESESKKIQVQLDLINDTWKNLLKRIVVNPMITTAPLLKNKTYRNKPLATTEVRLHNRDIEIANIASEGQIADLQLSFILAMANKYSWTPWKALLLDDPTQHHDLVHASSVFDVLRDYIGDLGYQVMISTHDALQADFFARKLRNDGIESKIYQLEAGSQGVTAKRIR